MKQKEKLVKVFQPVVDCTESTTVYRDIVSARKALYQMMEESPTWGTRHYFDAWSEQAGAGDIIGFGSGEEKFTVDAYINVLEIEEK